MAAATSPHTMPIARCPHCGARWVIARDRHPMERTQSYCCVACSQEYTIEDGVFVSVTRPFTEEAIAAIRDDDRKVAHQATALRKRAGRAQ